MTGYTKLFSSILDSTVWDASPEVRVVWITLLAMADRDGLVEASVPGLAKRAGVVRQHVEEALALFQSPDPDSRTKAHDGRRIAETDGGWVLLNHDKYRHKADSDDVREKAAARQQRFKERHAGDSRQVTQSNAQVTPGNAAQRPVTLVTRSNDIAEASPSASQKQIHTPDPEPSVCVCGDGTPWDIRSLERVMSQRRVLAGGGPYRRTTGDYSPMVETVVFFREQDPGAPDKAAAYSLDQWAASPWAREAQWPLSSWLKDPGKWLKLAKDP